MVAMASWRLRGRHDFFLFFILELCVLLFVVVVSHAAITEEVMLRAVGSRPPSCEGRCRESCGRRRHCVAVQVPVTPLQYQLLLHRQRQTSPMLRASSFSYDHSNYKPLGWGCKCFLKP